MESATQSLTPMAASRLAQAVDEIVRWDGMTEFHRAIDGYEFADRFRDSLEACIQEIVRVNTALSDCWCDRCGYMLLEHSEAGSCPTTC